MNLKWKLHKLILCRIGIHAWIPLLKMSEMIAPDTWKLIEIGQSCFYCPAKRLWDEEYWRKLVRK